MIAQQSLDCGDPAPLWLCCKTSVFRHLQNFLVSNQNQSGAGSPHSKVRRSPDKKINSLRRRRYHRNRRCHNLRLFFKVANCDLKKQVLFCPPFFCRFSAGKLSFSQTMCIVCEEYELEVTNCELKEVELEKSA